MCALLFFFGQSVVFAEEQGLIIDEPERQQGKGVIIELEDGATLPDEQSNNETINKAAGSKYKYGRKQIELIVGGQGQDGVAKRGSLIIEE